MVFNLGTCKIDDNIYNIYNLSIYFECNLLGDFYWFTLTIL